MKPNTKQSGFTLFEVILALSLSVVLMALLGMAIHFYLDSSSNNRHAVEEAQLARSLLQKIASDLRASLQYQAQDVSSAVELATELAAFDVDSLDTPAEGGADSSSDGIEGSTTLPPVLGVYGNEGELQVDISRIPRLDEFEALSQPHNQESVHRPTDIKTVAYFLRQGEAVSGSSVDATRLRGNQQQIAGLVRREMDRATTEWATENGDASILDAQGELLAPEVTGFQLRYFDGKDWLSEWDSEEAGGLPVAVHVQIWLHNAGEEQDAESVLSYSSTPSQTDSRYEIIVHLPNAVHSELGQDDSDGSSEGS